MHSLVRIIIIIAASIIFLIALSISGQVMPLYDKLPEHEEGLSTGPDNVSPLFSITVTPTEAHARPGDPVDCEVLLTPYNGFDQPVDLEVEVDAGAIFRGTYDAGSMNPPYPKTYKYRVVVPEKSPAPVIVNGTLRAKGGGYMDQVDLVLYIES